MRPPKEQQSKRAKRVARTAPLVIMVCVVTAGAVLESPVVIGLGLLAGALFFLRGVAVPALEEVERMSAERTWRKVSAGVCIILWCIGSSLATAWMYGEKINLMWGMGLMGVTLLSTVHLARTL
jgi:hypothetical protein